jgi:ParB/RepB/Spo0J family partition protein
MKTKTSGGVKSVELSSTAENRAARQVRPTDAGVLRRVPLDVIVPSPFQNRKTFKTADWAGFVESVRISGVIQPGVAREVKEKIELVCGERRFRASQELKLPDMPLIIRELTDAEVEEIIAIENLQREGLNALEEAQGFADWIARMLKAGTVKTMKEAVAHIEQRIGKKRSVIYEALRLVKLSDPAKKALEEGKLDLAKAGLIASVSPAMQPQLVKELLHNYGNREPMSAPRVRDLIDEKYQRQLNKAPFKLDAELKMEGGTAGKMPAARSHPLCTTCVFRSGNIEGFEGNPNVCTNVECYGAKVASHSAEELAKAAAAGARVMDAEEYEKRQYNLNEASFTCYADSKGRSYGTLAKLAGIEPIVAVDEEGELKQVFTSEDISKIKSANKLKDYSGGQSAQSRAADNARKKKEKEFDAIAKGATFKILEKLVTPKGIHQKLWLMLSDAIAQEAGIERTTFVAKRLGLCKTQTEANESLEAWLTSKERTDLDRMRFVVEVLICTDWNGGGWHVGPKWDDHFTELCKLAGGTPEALAKQQASEKIEHALDTHNKIVASLNGKAKQKGAKKTKGLSPAQKATIVAKAKARWAKVKAKAAK